MACVAPRCGFCKQTAPLYTAAAEAPEVVASGAVLAKIDCDENRAVCSRFGVEGESQRRDAGDYGGH